MQTIPDPIAVTRGRIRYSFMGVISLRETSIIPK